MTDNTFIPLDDLMTEQLQDPTMREDWERTLVARAVANQVILYRREYGLSQHALAHRLGVSQAVVGRLELGEHEPKLSTLSRLARVLGMRFRIDIHPADDADVTETTTVERLASDEIELIVTTG